MTKDEMVGWHHRLDGHEFEQVPGVGDRQRGLACCGPWGRKESDMTERLNWTEVLNAVGISLPLKEIKISKSLFIDALYVGSKALTSVKVGNESIWS